MNREEILARLKAQLLQLNRQFEVVAASGSHTPKLEMDRMLGDIRATYELFTVLNYVNTYPPAAAPVLTKEEIMATLPVAEKLPEPPPEPVAPPVVEKRPEPIVEKLPEKQPEPVAEKKPLPVTEKQPEKVYQKHADQTKETIQEQLKKQAENVVPFYKTTDAPPESIADKLRQTKVEDLRKVIPLHEKFMYINELFEGDNGPYNAFVDAVSRCTTKSEAEAVIAEAAARYKWDKVSKTCIKFTELIQRRFL